MTKKIYFEPAGRIFSCHKEVFLYPPEGYEFVVPESFLDRKIVGNDFIFFRLYEKVRWTLPVHLIKSWSEKFLKKPPPGTSLTFAWNHVVFRKEPWVVQVEWPDRLAGLSYRFSKTFKKTIEGLLASPYCKRILTWSEVARNLFFTTLDCTEFEHKIEVVPLAVHPKEFTKEYDKDKIKLLFVGSAHEKGNPLYNFHYKGGKELLEAFAILNQRYSNLELVIRTEVPPPFKKVCQTFDNIKLIEEIIPWEQLEQEHKSADIFLFPGYHTPFGVILEAMSYELPVVVTNIPGNRELVEDGVTGFIVGGKLPFYDKSTLYPVAAVKQEIKRLQTMTNAQVVEELVQKASILIENKELRTRMGKAARWEIEEGEHSIKRRNERLRRIFDEATSS